MNFETRDLMNKLKSEISFRLDEGVSRSKLAEIAFDNEDEECAELFSEHNCDISVRISKRTIEEGLMRFFCVSDVGEQSMDFEILNACWSAEPENCAC